MIDYRPAERWLAAAFSFLSGVIDSIGFLYLGGVFLSFMSGNTTRFATSVIEGETHLALLAGSCILLFIVGVMNGALTHHLATKYRGIGRAREMVLLNVSIVFALSAILTILEKDEWAILLLSVGVGTMNSIFQRNGEVAIPLTYMTGTLVKMGQQFIKAWFDGDHRAWLYHFSLWFSLSLGALLGALMFHQWKMNAVIFVSVATIALSITTYLARRQRRRRGLPI